MSDPLAEVPGHSPGAVLAAAESALNGSDLDTAKVLAEQAVVAARSADDEGGHARAIAFLARVLYIRLEPAQAMEQATAAIALSEAIGDPRPMAQAREVATRILIDVGDSAGALEEGLQAMEAAEASGDLEATASATRAMTNVYAVLQQWDKAMEFGERYRETTRLLGDAVAESTAIETLSFVHSQMALQDSERGDHARARERNEQAATLSRTAMLLARTAGNRRGENTSVANLAELLGDLGRHQAGLDLLDTWPADPRLDSIANRVHHWETRGILLAGLGRRPEAAELLARSVAEAPTRQHDIVARRILANLLEEMGDLRGALDHYKRLLFLISEQNSEQAQRAASVAAVRLETAQAQARANALESRTMALERSNETLNQQSAALARQVLEDPLTGLPNRRRLEQLLASDLQGCSVVLLDVDHFKRINDGHSHLVGDAVLRQLAHLLRTNCRLADTALRFGGEEFVFVMPGATRRNVLALAERVRRSIQRHDWTALAPGLAVTASLGVALGTEASSGIDLLALADRRLLAAKQHGRNQVVGPPPRRASRADHPIPHARTGPRHSADSADLAPDDDIQQGMDRGGGLRGVPSPPHRSARS